jgi:tagaturonate reductase
VGEAVDDPLVGAFIRRAVLEEIVPSLDIDAEMAQAFAGEVLERFANPFIQHDLLGITFQQTTKMRVRVVPSLVGYARKRGAAPPSLTFGFACFLLFLHPAIGPPVAERPADDEAARWQEQWKGVDRDDPEALRTFVASACADEALWGTRLDELPGFVDAVTEHLVRALRDGVPAALRAHLAAVSS